MKTTKVLATIVACLICSASAHADVVASYSSGVAATAGTTGAADPTSQGWTANGTITNFSHGQDSTNGGWRITDGTGASPYFYQSNLSASQALNMANGWTATFTVATNEDAVRVDGVPNGVANYYDNPNFGRQNDNAMWIEVNGLHRYILSFNSDANNDLQLSDGTSTFQITNAGNQLSSELGTTVANYVTYSVQYDAGTGNASLTDSLGGVHGVIATSGSATLDRVVWGATSSPGQGSTTWNGLTVTSVVPEPTSLGLIAFGLGTLVVRRRRKK